MKTTKNLNQRIRSPGPRFEPGTSRIRNMSVNHSTTTFLSYCDRVCVCVCVCVCVRARARARACVRVCVCVGVNITLFSCFVFGRSLV
jgi:hypothetical protein